MNTYETNAYLIKKSILGVFITQKSTLTTSLLADQDAELFIGFYEANLQIIPPSAIDAAMDDLCSHYFHVPVVNAA